MAFEHVSRISLNYDDNVSERQSRFYQTVPKFHISGKQMFSNRICLGLMENYDVSASVLISAATSTRERVVGAAVNVLPNSPKISHLTKREFF